MHGHGGGHGHDGEDPGHARDRHGNPEDHAGYLERLLDPERETWQKPDEVVAALGLRPGSLVCDVGAGPGVFALRMARVVGPGGRVHALDVDPRMIALLRARAAEAGLANVSPHLADDGRGLPPEPVDVVLLVSTFHHFPEPVAYLRALASRLRPGGRLVNVDFHAEELPVGPPPDHKVSREAFLAAAGEAGLEVVEERSFLPYQYFLVLRPR
jgi:ubiquinone/menaquinone biosynthesis C-methylase UbiE